MTAQGSDRSLTAEIRPIQSNDVPSVVSAYEWLFAPPGGPSPRWNAENAAATLADLIGRSDATALVADSDGDIRGFCTLYLDIRSVRYGQRAWLEDLAVHPDHRSAGIGRALLRAAKRWAIARGATHLELDSGLARLDAHRFYEREGPSWKSLCFGWELTWLPDPPG